MAVCVGLAGCVRTTPQPPPPPPPPAIVVPEGCTALLSGPWVHGTDPSFRYLGEDDGGTLTLTVFRDLVVDAGFTPRRFRPAPDAGGALDAGATAGAGSGLDAGGEAGALDAGPGSPPSVRLELTRTANGFTGLALAPLQHPSGRVCEGRFPTRVLSCADGGLLLETQGATALGDTCQAPARPFEQPLQRHPLVRPPDAG
jgi:hypothetical protein